MGTNPIHIVVTERTSPSADMLLEPASKLRSTLRTTTSGFPVSRSVARATSASGVIGQEPSQERMHFPTLEKYIQFSNTCDIAPSPAVLVHEPPRSPASEKKQGTNPSHAVVTEGTPPLMEILPEPSSKLKRKLGTGAGDLPISANDTSASDIVSQRPSVKRRLFLDGEAD